MNLQDDHVLGEIEDNINMEVEDERRRNIESIKPEGEKDE